MKQLSATLNNPSQHDLYYNTLKAICNILSSDSDLYIRQAFDCNVLDRLHAVIL